MSRAHEIVEFDKTLEALVEGVIEDDGRFKELATFIGLNMYNGRAKNSAVETASWLVDGGDAHNRLDALLAINHGMNG